MDGSDDIFQACERHDVAFVMECKQEGFNFNIRTHEERPLWEHLMFGGQSPAQAQCFRVMLQGGLRLDRRGAKGSSLCQEISRNDLELWAQALLDSRPPEVIDKATSRLEARDLQWWHAQRAAWAGRQLQTATPMPSRGSRGRRL